MSGVRGGPLAGGALSDQDLEERSMRLFTLWHSELLQVFSSAFVMGVTPGEKKKILSSGEGVRFLASSEKLQESPCPAI